MAPSAKVYMKQGAAEMVVADGGKITVEDGGMIVSAGSAAGAGLSPFWNDCPLSQMAVDPSLGVTDGDDFVSLAADGFPYDIVGANGTFLPLAGQQYGVGEAVAAGTDNDEITVSSNNNIAGIIKANADDNWWFEARIALNQIATAQGVFVGLSEEAGSGADYMVDDDMTRKVIDGIGFDIIAATDIAAIWQTAITLNGGARVAIDATAGTATAAFTKLGMKCVSGTVTFYIDGVALDTTTTSAATNFPLDQVMQFVIASKCGTGVENSMKIDWWRVAQLR